jgi:hypothetical protein
VLEGLAETAQQVDVDQEIDRQNDDQERHSSGSRHAVAPRKTVLKRWEFFILYWNGIKKVLYF